MRHFEINELRFSYPGAKPSLDGVSLAVDRGEYVVLCGKSGSGKTTLLRHLKTVLTPHGTRSGKILFCGHPLEEVSLQEQSAKIGYVMQNPEDQIVTDKVWHELAFGLESLGVDQKTMRARVSEMACYFGIQDWFHRDVAELSGGQKQLLNLASTGLSLWMRAGSLPTAHPGRWQRLCGSRRMICLPLCPPLSGYSMVPRERGSAP